MTTKVNITSDALSKHRVIVHISNDASTILLSPGESIEYALSQGMCINLIESEEDYSHGETDDLQTGTVVNQDGLSWLIAQFERAANCVVSPVDMPLEFSQKEGE